jgi:hypothetical protein
MFNLRLTLNTAHSLLQQAKISHALIGGFALAAYGYHRATADIDFLADGTKKDLIKSILTSNGFELRHESDEVLQFTGIGFLDILLANRPLSKKMLEKAKYNKELQIYMVCPEDIIGLKIQAYINDPKRELQDKADIQNLLSLPSINLSEIKEYADLFGEWPAIEKILGTKK